jgi:fumarylacetoacetase
MQDVLDETHDPTARSWVDSANDSATDFPIQNLPFGTFRRRGHDEPRLGVAIGDRVLDVYACIDGPRSVSELLAAPAEARAAVRLTLHRVLRQDANEGMRQFIAPHLLDFGSVDLLMPTRIGDYADVFGSIHHARNAAALMRPGAAFFPNYAHVPLAYHGRSSTIVESGRDVRRPRGQQRRRGAEGSDATVVYEPTRRLDYEAELGLFIGPGTTPGEPVGIDDAWNHVAGVCLLNDWSARDIQAWESDPLGPFMGKSFATTISPWIVTAEALAPFRVAAVEREGDLPPLLRYLDSADDRQRGALQIEVDVLLATAAMRREGAAPHLLTRTNAAGQFWTPAQVVAHITSNGSPLRPGDLIGSGTLSGVERSSWSCLLELTRGGREPITLPNGEQRGFLEDGDEVILRGRCVAPGARTIGFGDCRGRVVPA